MWSRSTAVPETMFAKCDILLQMRFGAICRIPLPMYRWIVLDLLVRLKHVQAVIHTTVLPYNRTRASFPLPLLFLLLQVWLHRKHFRMILEQRRFYQLLHWQTFSYWEKATCSIVASHCMTKHDVLTCASTPVAAWTTFTDPTGNKFTCLPSNVSFV